MNIIIKILCFVLIFQIVCISVAMLLNRSKSVIKKIKINKIEELIELTDIKKYKFMKWLNTKTIVIMVLVLFVLLILIFNNAIGNYFLTVVFVMPFSFLPIFLLLMYLEFNKIKMENNVINYILQLKNQAKISDDVIKIIENVLPYTQKPLNKYIESFLNEIDMGMNVSIAFDKLRTKIKFKRFNQLLYNLENCYYNGGNIYGLLEKTANVFGKYQKERIKRNEQTLSARVVLMFLMFLTIFIYFIFIKSNVEIYDIMINDLIGYLILFLNIFSVWIMIFLIFYVKKTDE